MLFLLSILLLSARVPAATGIFDPEAGRPVIRNYSPAEYRGHPQIFDLAVSNDGLVFLVDEEGVIEFDGVAWRHHNGAAQRRSRIAPAGDGALWVGSANQIGRLEQGPTGLRQFRDLTAGLPEDFRRFERLRNLVRHGDAVYFATSRGIVRWQGGRFHTWARPGGTPTLHSVGPWLYVQDSAGISRLEGDRLVAVSNAAILQQAGRIIALPLPGNRVLWGVGTAGLFVMQPDGAVEPLATPANAIIDRTQISAGLQLRDGTLAIGTINQGLLLLAPDARAIRHLDRRSGLADNVVHSLAEDAEGGLWLGSNSGVSRIDLGGAVTVFDAENGPTHGAIDVWGRHEGRLYAGCYDGLYLLTPADDATGRGPAFRQVVADLSNVVGIESVAGELLVTSREGVSRIGPDHRPTLLVPAAAGDRPLTVAPSRLRPHRLYVGGEAGFTVIDRGAAAWRVTARYPDTGDIHNLLEEPDGTLWLSTYANGFWRIPAAAAIDDWAAVRPEHYHRDAGLPGEYAWTTVYPAPGGTAFCTSAGARRFDPATRRFGPETRFVVNGRAGLLCVPMALTAGGEAWTSIFADSLVSAAHPFGRFRPGPGGALRWFGAPHAAQQQIGFAGTAVIHVESTPAGETVWSRGYNRTVRIELARAEPATAPWRATLRSFEARGTAQPLPAAAPSAPHRLDYSRDPIAFTYSATHFAGSDALRFQTRLAGHDADWSAPSAANRAVYTNLEGGPFTFMVRAIDAEGRVSEPARLEFVVRPPWERSGLAYVLYAVALAGGVAGFVQWRLRAAGAKRRELEHTVAQRTAQLAVARDEAQAANRAKSTFLAHMSHELRTPLNGVIGYAQVLLGDRTLTGAQRERVQIVHASGTHLLRLINEVLDFSKIEAGRIERHDTPFHPGQLLRELASLHAAAAAAKGLAFTVAGAEALPEFVRGDPQKLRQVLDNLLSNAVKFTRAGRVELAVCRAGSPDPVNDHWEFSVSDTGVGLSGDELAGLFQPFAQAAGRPAGESGTGLGLVITRRLVQLLGGDLRVDSTPGRGSRFAFTLTLPAAAAPSGASRPPFAAGGYEGPARRVLIVDDHAVNRTLLAELLTPLGFLCDCHASAEDALAVLADARPPDIALLDVKLPGLDGLELTRRLRARPATATLPIVLTSASVLTFDAAAAAQAGSHDFLPKPFVTGQLLELLTRLLGLTWRAAPAETTGHAALDPALVPDLLAAADAGDIMALRAALRTARERQPSASSSIDQLEKLAAGYQLERVRQLLRDPDRP